MAMTFINDFFDVFFSFAALHCRDSIFAKHSHLNPLRVLANHNV